MATSSPSKYNARSSSVKRLLQEAKELASLTEDGIYAAPLEDNLHEFHFCIRGPEDSEFKGGIYHGRIILPPQYPFKAPDIMLMTPNGRFELNKKICLSITGYHDETWQPAWGIRTALVGLASFFSTEAKGAIGGIDAPEKERRRLAALSKDWTCPTCAMKNIDMLPPSTGPTKEEKGKGRALDESATDVPAPTSGQAAVPEAAQPANTEIIDAPALDRSDELSSSLDTVVPSTPPNRHVSPMSTPQHNTDTRPGYQSNTTGGVPQQEQNVPVADLFGVSQANLARLRDEVPGARATAGGGARPAAQSLRASNVSARPLHAVSLAGQSGGGIGAAAAAAVGRELRAASPPPVWLDGMIGCVLIALASLLCRKML